MPNASELLKTLLDDLGIEYEHGSEPDSVLVSLDHDCEVEIYKHPYSGGYSMHTKCKCGNANINSKADYIESILLSTFQEKASLHGTSVNRAMNAANLTVSTKIKNREKWHKTTRTWIKCDYSGNCIIKKEKQ